MGLVLLLAACGSVEFASHDSGPLDQADESGDPARLEPADGSSNWTRFRGPNGSGVADDVGPLPTRFGPETNVVWTVPLPPGYSSPIVQDKRPKGPTR